MRRTGVFVVALTLAGAAGAGEQYVDKTGYAASGFDVIEFFTMTQAPVGEEQPRAVRGTTLYTFPYNGATWAFVSAENRDRFAIHPQIYAPQYDGHSAYAVAHGGKVPGNPHLWRIVDGKLYFNITSTVVELWERDIAGNIAMADANWLDLEANPQSALEIPQFEGRSGPILASFADPATRNSGRPGTGDDANGDPEEAEDTPKTDETDGTLPSGGEAGASGSQPSR